MSTLRLLFNVVAVPFRYERHAPKPTVWLDFLSSVWGGDDDSIALLQQYFGYVLSGQLDQQKLLMLIGPTRSGKGTIARILTSLVGRGNVAGPTLASLGTNFGLSPLIGKPLAIISDARLGNAPSHTVVERLLSLTGEDTLTIDRKFREPWTGKLPTRFCDPEQRVAPVQRQLRCCRQSAADAADDRKASSVREDRSPQVESRAAQ